MTSFEKQKAAAERARARRIAKLNCPIEQEKRKAKALASAERNRERQQARLNDPEYQAAQREKKLAQLERRRNRTKTKAAITRSSPIKSKGLKGRAPTTEEREVMDKIGSLPCIACAVFGRHQPVISLHHTDGRTKPDAHKRCLPLCANHHDTPADLSIIRQYPDLVTIHARGTVGGKTMWSKYHGDESRLVDLTHALVGLIPVDELSNDLQAQYFDILPVL